MLEAIREKHPDIKVVVLSAFSDEEHIRAAFHHGANAYVVKSVNPIDLPSAIRQAFEATVFQGFRVMSQPAQEVGSKQAGSPSARWSPQGRRARALESGDQQGVLGHRADGEVPPQQHLPQARRAEPDRGHAVRVQERPRQRLSSAFLRAAHD